MAKIKTTVFTIPTQAYSGVATVPATSIASDASQILVTLDVSLMTDPATSYDWAFEISYDSGATWGFLIGVTRPGGVLLDKLGNPVPTASFGVGLLQVGSTTRQLRGTVTIVGTITIGGTVNVLA